ncbi:MAG: hypothetical protein LBD67_08055 [Candidatus Accumulibacter sp.]|jgi:hypothetical protein|nr:hypothetical protein [Accumulibacter sp.]
MPSRNRGVETRNERFQRLDPHSSGVPEDEKPLYTPRWIFTIAMKSFRAFLTLLFFLLAQAGALAHAAAHHWHDAADAPAAQECAACLAAQNLDCALPAQLPAAAFSQAVCFFPSFETLFYAGARRVFWRARAPPVRLM